MAGLAFRTVHIRTERPMPSFTTDVTGVIGIWACATVRNRSVAGLTLGAIFIRADGPVTFIVANVTIIIVVLAKCFSMLDDCAADITGRSILIRTTALATEIRCTAGVTDHQVSIINGKQPSAGRAGVFLPARHHQKTHKY